MENSVSDASRRKRTNTRSYFEGKGKFFTIQLGLVLMMCVWFAFWAYKLPFNQGPDEYMRYQIPAYIYNNWSLPTGYEPEVIHTVGNWSYAFYPQMLGAIISAFFMHLMNLFYSTDHSLLVAARGASVLFGALGVLFTGKSVYKLTGKKAVSLLSMVALGFLPQYTFLSCYVNNDIIAVAGASMIVYAMIAAYDEAWNYKHSLIFSAGVIVCGLGYSNSYGFILFGGLFFVIVNIMNIKNGITQKKDFYKNFLLVFVICAVVIFPFFIRNYILHKDILGLTVFNKEYTRWLDEGGAVLQVPFAGNWFELIRNKDFIGTVFRSFVGLFGYMAFPMTMGYYLFYMWIFGLGIVGFILRSVKNRTALDESADVKWKKRWLVFFVIAACVTTVILHLYYVLYIDYQAQGRYIMAIVSPLMVIVVAGLSYYVDGLIKPEKRILVYFILGMVYILINYLVYKNFVTLSFV
ncbi:phospholipid carrier-dependent glycosyltransferase [uncultured Enterococcus sp.]|uniref:phospholipid carrier-dependent glycosyltransferase n=1 Tax=uncultured Enterococcus sp. TaxID=167972 RepID=UPI002AA8C068|nr:phospholipid carrier-dependent glycosyltransferase [uncultured Enterococcus sp.]